jgi:hypothetical protein
VLTFVVRKVYLIIFIINFEVIFIFFVFIAIIIFVFFDLQTYLSSDMVLLDFGLVMIGMYSKNKIKITGFSV